MKPVSNEVEIVFDVKAVSSPFPSAVKGLVTLSPTLLLITSLWLYCYWVVIVLRNISLAFPSQFSFLGVCLIRDGFWSHHPSDLSFNVSLAFLL